MTDSQRQTQEELELRAIEILQIHFTEMYLMKHRRRKLRKFSVDEMPWRSQLNMVQGLSQFGVFMLKLEGREKVVGGGAANYMYR